MKTIEETRVEIEKRRKQLITKRKRRKQTLTAVCGTLCSVLLIIGISVALPDISGGGDQISQYYGTMLLSTNSLGHIIIGCLAFLLGVLVTILCIRNSGGKDQMDR